MALVFVILSIALYFPPSLLYLLSNRWGRQTLRFWQFQPILALVGFGNPIYCRVSQQQGRRFVYHHHTQCWCIPFAIVATYEATWSRAMHNALPFSPYPIAESQQQGGGLYGVISLHPLLDEHCLIDYSTDTYNPLTYCRVM